MTYLFTYIIQRFNLSKYLLAQTVHDIFFLNGEYCEFLNNLYFKKSSDTHLIAITNLSMTSLKMKHPVYLLNVIISKNPEVFVKLLYMKSTYGSDGTQCDSIYILIYFRLLIHFSFAPELQKKESFYSVSHLKSTLLFLIRSLAVRVQVRSTLSILKYISLSLFTNN